MKNVRWSLLVLCLPLAVGCSEIDAEKITPLLELGAALEDSTPDTITELRNKFSKELAKLEYNELTPGERRVVGLLDLAATEWLMADVQLDHYRRGREEEHRLAGLRYAQAYLDKANEYVQKARLLTEGNSVF
ncbi:hypothetical protein Pan216_52530 [Planctomycetes bacterium Pan216]|uniref:Uncharacterized protein n=1 Tax=Kolteria novifilia TaxID=2527975 RepID=A0A518BBU1_9BACT|nr:hypothetical protein Pan216_52530 [Planctomycetes bacterium Pan216]